MDDPTFTDYARRGFVAMPLKAGQKVAYDMGWNEPDYEASPKVWETWDGQRNRLNVGILTRRSGIFVLDVDSAREGHPLDGFAALERLTAEYGPLPDTFTVRTRAGGLHYYFKDVPGLRKDNRGRVGPGIDVQADRAYVVAPPSWVDADEKGPAGAYTVEKDLEVAEAPAWLVALAMREPERRPEAAQRVAVGAEGGEFPDAYVASVVERECASITDAVDGQQNDTINRASFSLGTLVGAGALDHVEAYDVLLATSLRGGHPRHRAVPTIESGLAAGMKKPRVAPDPREGAVVETEGSPRTPETTRSGWSLVEVGSVVDGLLDGTLEWPTPDVARLDYRDPQEDEERPAGLFYRGHVNDIHGASNSAKSWLAILAMRQEIEAGNHVFYIDAEDNEKTAVLRLLQVGATPDAIKARFHYVYPDGAYTPTDQGRLMGWLDAVEPTLVVIDSTGEALGLDGIDSNADGEVAQWYARLPRPIAKRGVAVVLVDHVTKAMGESASAWDVVDASGSGRKRNGIDGASYYVHALVPFKKGVGGASSVVCTKDRHGAFARGDRVGVMAAAQAERMRGTGLDIALQPWADMTEAERAVYDPQAGQGALDRRNRVLIALPLHGQPGVGRNDLSRTTGIAPADVGTTLKKLAADGLAVNGGTTAKASWTKAPTTP